MIVPMDSNTEQVSVDMSTLELYLRMRIVYARAHDRLATVAKEVQ